MAMSFWLMAAIISVTLNLYSSSVLALPKVYPGSVLALSGVLSASVLALPRARLPVRGDPSVKGPRTGNWTTLQCNDPAVTDLRDLTGRQRWDQLGCPDAWKDLIETWKSLDKPPNQVPFSQSISNNVHATERSNCGKMGALSLCVSAASCNDVMGLGSGPAGYLIWNSMVQVHNLYQDMYTAIHDSASTSINNALEHFENTFAPVPPPKDDTGMQIFFDLVGLGLPVGFGPFITKFLGQLPYFIAKEGAKEALKDTSFALISTGVSIAKDLDPKNSAEKWSAESKAQFSDFIGQTLTAWAQSISDALEHVFRGEDDSIATLTSLISDGKWVEGYGYPANTTIPQFNQNFSIEEMTGNITRAVFGYAIPAIWTAAGTHAFVVDSGTPCGTVDPMTEYITPNTQHATWGCHEERLYYLVAPLGYAHDCKYENGGCTRQRFSAPPGIGSLNGSAFGGIRVEHIIQGAVRTYIANGKQNGGAIMDPLSRATFDDIVDNDVTSPGFIRLPVCSPDMAFKAWDRSDVNRPNYPCSTLEGKNHCGASTFIDQTSDASPLVTDCLQLVTNLATGKRAGDWPVENAVGSHHELARSGGCRFGVHGIKKNGNIDFHVGSQDIIDIIHDSIKQFGKNGKVGSKGIMSCKGTVKGQDVEWGLY